jgi:hypothetical protein
MPRVAVEVRLPFAGDASRNDAFQLLFAYIACATQSPRVTAMSNALPPGDKAAYALDEPRRIAANFAKLAELVAAVNVAGPSIIQVAASCDRHRRHAQCP